MTPDMRVRITAQNEASPAFRGVVEDAWAAANAVDQAGKQAATALGFESTAVARLRAEYVPTFAAQLAHETAIQKIAIAEKSGALSAAEAAEGVAMLNKHLVEGAAAASLNSVQQLALMHSARSIVEQLAMGASPVQALTSQLSHLSYVASGEGGVMGALRGIGALLAPLAPVLLGIGAAVGAVALTFAGLTTKINETAKTHVSFGNVFLATVQLAAEGIGKFFAPAIAQLGRWWQQFVDWIGPIFKGVGNLIVGVFVGAYDATKQAWGNLPTFFSALGKQAYNNLISEFEKPLLTFGDQVIIPGINASGLKAKLSPAEQASFGATSVAFGNALSTDYMGSLFSAISERSQALQLAEDTKKAGGAAAAANDNFQGLGNSVDDLTGKTNAWADAAKSAFSNLGTGIIQAFQKGGNVALNILGMIGDRIGQLGESLLNSGLNALLGNVFSGVSTASLGIATPNIGSAIGASLIPGYATGADFMVGGAPGTDRNLVAFKASKGERVQVTPPGAANGNDFISVAVTTTVVNGNLVPTMVQVSGVVAGKMIKTDAPLAVATARRNKSVG